MPALALTINGITEQVQEEHKEAAMLRYWQARQAGDQTAKLIRLADYTRAPDDGDEDPPSPAAPALAAPAAAVPVPAGTVSAVAVERISLHEQWLTEAGFSVPPPLFAPGTRVVALGNENFRIERRRVEDLPLFPVTARRIVNQIDREDRDDLRVNSQALAMDERGRLVVGENHLGLEVGAFRQLAILGGFGYGLRYLTELCPSDLRADNVNHQFRAQKDRELVLRTRAAEELGDNGGGIATRQVFAVVTPTYSAVDTDIVLRAIEDHLEDAHTEMRYDGTGVRATALFMPDEVIDLAAGDIFKVGVRVETDDTGNGRIRISGVVFRNLCLNLIIIGEGEVETVAQVHRGDPNRILNIVKGGVDRARESIANFLEAWGHARTVRVAPAETLKKWVEEKRLFERNRKDTDNIVQALLSSWRKEPGDTLADCVNAVSRAAHETPSWDINFREELERRAARLVLVPR